MGYYFGYANRKAIRDEVTEHGRFRSCYVGNVLWVQFDGPPKPAIGCFLLVRSAQNGASDWGYKPMDESMGPCFYSCPKSYLEAIPDPKEGFSTEWREKVLRYHTRITPKDLERIFNPQ